MELIKQNWTDDDITQFYVYEKTLKSNLNDCTWEQKIVNTTLDCYGKTSYKAKQTAKKIKKGNYIEFVSKLKVKTHFDSLVLSYLICSIKDFEIFEHYLDLFVETIDNWASADTLKFEKRDNEKLVALSKKYLQSSKPFVRRVGVNIWFELIKHENYFNMSFDVLNSLKNEQEYYVNMCGAWLLSCCFVKNKQRTYEFFKNNHTNSFIINKAISKCRDSFRVSEEDKQNLLNFRVR